MPGSSSAVPRTYARVMEYRFGELTVACTHPERVMFPEDGITKGELLAALGLPAFVKTTGSKGLHVVVPLDDAAGFEQAGALGTRVGAYLCRRHPDILTMEFYKKDRKGRLFMDVMRNAIGATVIAPY